MKHLLILISILMLSSGESRPWKITLGNRYDDIGEETAQLGIAYLLPSYIGTYHEYPRNGADVVRHRKRLDSIRCAYDPDYAAYLAKYYDHKHKIDSLRVIYGENYPDTSYWFFNPMNLPPDLNDRILLDRRNVFKKRRCVIYPPRKREGILHPKIKVIGTLSDWQKGSADLFYHHAVTAYYNKEGKNFWRVEDAEDTVIVNAFAPVQARHRYTVFIPVKRFDGMEVKRPFKIRVRYSKQTGLEIVKESSLPKIYYLRDHNKNKYSYQTNLSWRKLLSEEYLAEIEQTLREIVSSDERIDMIDCYVPVCCD